MQPSDSAHSQHDDSPRHTRLSPGRTLPLLHLMTLGSGSYTQQSSSHAIARAQAFTRPSSNSPRALATHWHTAAAAFGTVRVRLPGLPQNRATQDTSRASQSSHPRIQPSPPIVRHSTTSFSNQFHHQLLSS